VIIFYLGLLFAGIACFVLNIVAQFRFAALMRTRYPEQWKIIAQPDEGRPSKLRTWTRLQHVLRSGAPALFQDRTLSAWHRCWRITPWIAWPCWFAALAVQWLSR
jgi:hypothetical protein